LSDIDAVENVLIAFELFMSIFHYNLGIKSSCDSCSSENCMKR